MEWYRLTKQYVVPVVFPSVFTLIALVLPLAGQSRLTFETLISTAFSIDKFAVVTVAVYIVWSILWLKIPSKQTYGPTTTFRHTPVYQDNGLQYYIASLSLTLIVYWAKPNWAILAYQRMPEVTALLNMLSLAICALLTVKGLLYPQFKENIDAPPQFIFNVMYRFWCGSELNPRICGIDIKQLIICRVGLMVWQQLIVAFFLASYHLHGFSLPLLFNTLLQSIYLLKFFYWESGYFHTIDIIEDRASYYLCWGTGVWVPVFYTWSTYYLVDRRPTLSSETAWLLAVAGVLSILFNYLVDLEKQVFRRTGKSFLPGKTSSMNVTYTDDSGKIHKTTLLTSGFWGSARHLNYTFEISLTACWCFMGWGTGYIAPNLYLIFLTSLLVHRFYRDHDRCLRKYGTKQWDAYCRAVPYKFIPYIF